MKIIKFTGCLSIFAFCILAFFINNSFAESEVKPEPDIKFDEAEHDFGTIGQFEEHTYVFKFKNLGDGTLNIGNVRTSCGCTAALVSSKEIPPKGDGEIKVVFDSGEFENKVTKTIYIESNDPDEPTASVKIKANITPMVYIEPRHIYLGKIEKGESITKKIFISINEKDLKITKVESLSEKILAKLSELPEGTKVDIDKNIMVATKNSFLLEITLNPGTEIGRFNSYVKLHTNNAKIRIINIIVQAEVMGDIRLNTDILSFVISKKNPAKQYEIMLNDVGKGVFEITKVESSLDWLSNSVSEIERGRKYKVTITPKSDLPADLPTGFSRGNITIHTNNTEQPILNVTIYVNVNDN